MKKRCLLLFLLPLFIISCSDNEKPQKELTFIIYMAADNSLSSYALADINEMEYASYDASQINVIVQADFSRYAEDPACRRYLIVPDGINDGIISSPVIENLGEIDSGDWLRLTEFYNWAVKEFPAKKYILSIWSHGNNWYSHSTTPNHFCPDNESLSWFDIPGNDLENALQNLHKEPDLLLLDACHMQSVEIAAEIAPYVDCFCSSTDIIPVDGFPYNDLLTYLNSNLYANLDFSAFPQIYTDSYIPGGSQNYQGQINQPIGASLLYAQVFTDSLMPLIKEVVDYYQSQDISNEPFFEARLQCYEFNDYDSEIDLFQYFYLLRNTDVDENVKSLCDSILELEPQDRDFYNYPSYHLANILVWFPKNTTTFYDLESAYSDLNFDSFTNWGSLILNVIDDDIGHYCP